MDGPALSWYQWMYHNGLVTSWQSLLQALESHFAPLFYDDPRSALFKLSHTSSITEYLTEFERLANWIVGLPHPFLLSCFISGLTSDIRHEVQALQPMTLPQTVSLARLQEDKLTDRRQAFRPKFSLAQPPPAPPITSTYSPSPISMRPPAPFLTGPSKPHYKKLSPDEIVVCREKGLCYNCDEKFSPSHLCNARFFLLIAEDDAGESPLDLEPPFQPD